MGSREPQPATCGRIAVFARVSCQGQKSPSEAILRSALLALLGAGLGLGATAMRDELAIRQASRTLAQAAFDGLVPHIARTETARTCHESELPRLLSSCTILHLRLSRKLDEETVRRRHLTLAQASADRFASLVPLSPVAATQQAMTATFAAQKRDRYHAIAALERSYRLAAIQRDVSLWRVSYGARHWHALSAILRQSVYDEAMWIARLGGSDRTAVMRELAGTALYLPVALRLPGRHGDALPPARMTIGLEQPLSLVDQPAQ